nr:MAG TPA: hypothetical protein [Bacteriophage sp.]
MLVVVYRHTDVKVLMYAITPTLRNCRTTYRIGYDPTS